MKKININPTDLSHILWNKVLENSAIKSEVYKKEFESIIEKIKCLEEDKFEDPFLLNLLGATYLKLNDKKNAKLYFSHAIALEPNHREAIINLANLDYNSLIDWKHHQEILERRSA